MTKPKTMRPQTIRPQTASPQKTKAVAASGAKVAANPSPLNGYLNSHLKLARSTLRLQLERPLAALITCLVIGVTFVLPALLAILLVNIQSISHSWDGSAQITLVLKTGVSALEGGSLANKMATQQGIKATQFIDNKAALKEFSAKFELEGAISYLDENPLPHVILVKPDDTVSGIERLKQLRSDLEALPAVEKALLDVMWVQRLQSITEVLQKTVWIIASMLGLAVVLILGNTIRLAIDNRKEEIAVVKLVGGTDSFVRRPFLYLGVFYGLGGALVALGLISLTLSLLEPPIQELANSYQSHFKLSGLDWGSTLILLALGIGLGWLGAWLAVRKHLDEIQPT